MSTLRSRQAALAHEYPGLRGSRAVRWVDSGLRALGRTVDLVLTWQERARQRHELQSLNDHMLRDIGLTRADVMAEATKPFWQP
jgi:uncharacterized protein YjiS (DUF1127 family)